jgi:hypothetical protein
VGSLTAATRQQHRYESCRDEDCERPWCRIWREAWDEGYREGYAEGQAAGFEAGFAAATANCSCG